MPHLASRISMILLIACKTTNALIPDQFNELRTVEAPAPEQRKGFHRHPIAISTYSSSHRFPCPAPISCDSFSEGVNIGHIMPQMEKSSTCSAVSF